jgi:hypothetical protein
VIPTANGPAERKHASARVRFVRAPDGQPLAFELADGTSGRVFQPAMWCHGQTGQQIAGI